MTQKKILIVEDNELNMKLFRDLLENAGYLVVGTSDGVGAYALVREEMPDLILMDIQLPEISGLDITRKIKADQTIAHIPVIAVTAFAMQGDEEKIRQGGCQGYLAKPISIPNFLATVRQVLA